MIFTQKRVSSCKGVNCPLSPCVSPFTSPVPFHLICLFSPHASPFPVSAPFSLYLLFLFPLSAPFSRYLLVHFPLSDPCSLCLPPFPLLVSPYPTALFFLSRLSLTRKTARRLPSKARRRFTSGLSRIRSRMAVAFVHTIYNIYIFDLTVDRGRLDCRPGTTQRTRS